VAFEEIMSKANPWGKVGWIEMEEAINQSPCCGVSVFMSRGDGVTMGTCAKCDQVVVRINSKTGKQEVPDTEFWN
jgi:hypothetical protein